MQTGHVELAPARCIVSKSVVTGRYKKIKSLMFFTLHKTKGYISIDIK